MKKTLIKLFVYTITLLAAAVTWAYFWPPFTDEEALIAPATMEEFYPLNGPTEPWENLFSRSPNSFEQAFDSIDVILDAPDASNSQSDDIQVLLDTAFELSQVDQFDIPYFSSEKEIPTDLARYRNYIRYVTSLPIEENEPHYEAALHLSEVYLTRSKTVVDYMIAHVSIKLLNQHGYPSQRYIHEWRAALGRAIKSEYYFARAGDGLQSRFLFQENTTWNHMWRYYSLLDQSIQKGDIAEANAEGEQLAMAWAHWPYTNLTGELILGMALPAFTHVYESSLELEQEIIATLRSTDDEGLRLTSGK